MIRAALLLVIASAASAQSAQSATEAAGPFRAVGVVRDSMGTPIPGASVSTNVASATTDSLGRFALRLTRVDSTTVTIRRLGFEEVVFTMLTDSLALNDLEIMLEPVARTLPGVNVEARAARVPTLERFAERRQEKAGFGYFLGRDEIAQRDGMPLSSLLRDARGVSIARSGGRMTLRFTQWSSRRGCAPHVWIDGARIRGFEIDDMRSADVEAIELYANASSAPVEFAAGDFACGIVAIWTRRPILKSR